MNAIILLQEKLEETGTKIDAYGSTIELSSPDGMVFGTGYGTEFLTRSAGWAEEAIEIIEGLKEGVPA